MNERTFWTQAKSGGLVTKSGSYQIGKSPGRVDISVGALVLTEAVQLRFQLTLFICTIKYQQHMLQSDPNKGSELVSENTKFKTTSLSDQSFEHSHFTALIPSQHWRTNKDNRKPCNVATNGEHFYLNKHFYLHKQSIQHHKNYCAVNAPVASEVSVRSVTRRAG